MHMRLISIKIPPSLLEEVDNLVKQGLFPSRSEAVRAAVRDLVREWREGRA